MIRSHVAFDSMHDEVAVSIYMKDNDVTSSDSLMAAGRELKATWESRKALMSRPILSLARTAEASNSSLDLQPPTMPTSFITVNSRGRDASNRKSENGEKTGKQSSSIPSILREKRDTSRGTMKGSVVYRKWGDELLPNGLVYPAIAPPMPKFADSTQ